ncbi:MULTISPECIES: hypothetical protein [unclassified Bradyrhizobium]|uniref:hypothetical protein n=1 Tax=unclassified Bradyrhizobium TaxID=2631580 RepID=UPI0020B44BC3|nr:MULTISPECIES: hypothetical protein [unclassified Bradyrhizobium]MCP3383559.1 hypothetical protein [Bradyrhizobium sp. CCGUVB4N]MCP3444644.1 hypothetical protein [Bradyrhizobium sp. CCGUVB14]
MESERENGIEPRGVDRLRIAVLRNGLQMHPNDRDMLSAALTLSRERGDSASAVGYAEQLSRLMQGNREIEDLIKQLKQ